MVTQIVSGHVFLVYFLSVFFRVFTEYHDVVKRFLISPASMLIVSVLTVAETYNIRNEVIRYALTLHYCNQMDTQILSGCVFLVCFLSAFFRVFAEYHDFVKRFLISPASMLIVSVLTVAGTFNIRNEVINFSVRFASSFYTFLF
ncbi:hypothetical protein WN944_007127 [Citrus x changshan-huyou]|uniref:Uncharacterized protein n=1 Tax=Citrus x changshan-huyou TaxID=2935761 RepID=A0AAP0MMP5_9ROSI